MADFDGRILRLFRRGQNEEATFVDDLRLIGVTVHEVDPDTGEQFRILDCNGHFGGSLDGKARGIPDAPKTEHVLEFKTHGEKSFKDVQAKGVKESKPMHYAQMQAYMLKSGLDRALYGAVNKNTDEYYFERVKLDRPFAKNLLKKAGRIIDSYSAPDKISDNPTWFECKSFCNFYDVCHGKQIATPTCRSCMYASPVAEGKWQCTLNETELSYEAQLEGCGKHRYLPDMLANVAKYDDAVVDSKTGELAVHYEADGIPFMNSTKQKFGYTSLELYSLKGVNFSLLGDDEFQKLRDDFEGEIV